MVGRAIPRPGETGRGSTARTGGFMETETMMQPDDANPVPLRMSHQGLGTLIIRFVGLLFLSVTALALVWIH